MMEAKHMIDSKTFLGGVTGTLLSFSGMSIAEFSTILSIISSILGISITVVTCIILPLIRAIKEAKADGKVTIDEVENIVKVTTDGIQDVKETIDSKVDNDK